jgi:2-polyprenyl-6-methoxyphenol hydroxylase-like FAD-dependent oxidoreductase
MDEFKNNKMPKGMIIGAGIGGLTTAIALAQKRIETKVFEQASVLTEIGAGIWVAPNGLKVYEKLELANDIIEAGRTLEKISVVDIKQNPISVIDGEKVRAKHGFKTVAIHRGKLQQVLLSKIPKENLVLGKRFKSYSQASNKVIAEFEDGSRYETDFLIIADGIKSNGRLQLNSDSHLRYSGQSCWRFVTEFEYPKAEDGNMYEIWSNKKGLRVGYSQINSKQVYVFITNYEKAGGKDSYGALKQNLLQLCNDFPEIVKEMIRKTDAEKIIRTDLFDFKPISRWVDRNVALLGDAAHATTPNLGQGACQAIEDAFVIAEQLALNSECDLAFANYQRKRIAKAKFVTTRSWQFCQITNTTGLTKSILKTLLRATPGSINERQLNKIYSLDYE